MVREQQLDAVIGMDFFLQPNLLGKHWFNAQSRPVWQERFDVLDEVHTLYVFVRVR